MKTDSCAPAVVAARHFESTCRNAPHNACVMGFYRYENDVRDLPRVNGAVVRRGQLNISLNAFQRVSYRRKFPPANVVIALDVVFDRDTFFFFSTREKLPGHIDHRCAPQMWSKIISTHTHTHTTTRVCRKQ
jgi:hypothetical protein